MATIGLIQPKELVPETENEVVIVGVTIADPLE